MSTLHERIRAVVEERLRVAREAAGPTRWEAESDDMGHFDVFTFDADGDMCEVANRIYKTDAEFIAACDPADAILGAEHALWILEEHAIVHRNIGWLEEDEGELCETYAEIPVCGKCVPKHSHFRTRADVPEGPCIEIRELATRWRVEVDG